MIKLEIELSERGAKALWTAMQGIGGNPEGPRGVIDKINRALSEHLGIKLGSDLWREMIDMYESPDHPNYLAEEWPEGVPDCKVRLVADD